MGVRTYVHVFWGFKIRRFKMIEQADDDGYTHSEDRRIMCEGNAYDGDYFKPLYVVGLMLNEGDCLELEPSEHRVLDDEQILSVRKVLRETQAAYPDMRVDDEMRLVVHVTWG